MQGQVGVEVYSHYTRSESAICEQGTPNPVVVVVSVDGQQIEVPWHIILAEEFHDVLCRHKLRLHDVSNPRAVTAATMRRFPWLRIQEDPLPTAKLPQHGAVEHTRLACTKLDIERCRFLRFAWLTEAHILKDCLQNSVLAALAAYALLHIVVQLSQPRPLLSCTEIMRKAPIFCFLGTKGIGPSANVMLPTGHVDATNLRTLVRARHSLPMHEVVALKGGTSDTRSSTVNTSKFGKHLPNRPLRGKQVKERRPIALRTHPVVDCVLGSQD
mmetsp:Transcript_76077/g.167999  ORF Transcript_76077/g.167999 Transcript_76077/m.167999 type:complete len:271 (+) Transcript_76077:478-1290(+)